jgi:transcriptional regulator with XRE-family HTH domain
VDPVFGQCREQNDSYRLSLYRILYEPIDGVKPDTTAHTTSTFSKALRLARAAHGTPQDAFDLVSSRTYVSALERGVKNPTLPKVDELASVLAIHPLTLLTLSYIDGRNQSDKALDALLVQVRAEAGAILLATKSQRDRK